MYATINDYIINKIKTKKLEKEKEEIFKEVFMTRLSGIDQSLADSPYIRKRLRELKYRPNSKINAYILNKVQFLGNDSINPDNWVINHETVHGIVNKSTLTAMGIVEGITDLNVGRLLPRGNYSQNCQLSGGKIQVNTSGAGQNNLVTFARQLEYGLGDQFDILEMFTHPHEQIKKFSKIYGSSKCRMLLHKINNSYHDSTLENYKIAQEFMLETIFDKKFESVTDQESARKYFEELINFGLLRGRINGKDEALATYYSKKQEQLQKKGIDIAKLPKYIEKPFYPCGDVYFRYNTYLKSCIEARKKENGTNFEILYNKNNTCVYILVDGVLNHIQNDSVENKRSFTSNMIDSTNSMVIPLENGNYLITGPDGVTEEVRNTNSKEKIDKYFEKIEERKSVGMRK